MLLKKEKQKKRKKKTEANCFKYCMRRTSRGGGDGWAGAEVGRAPVDGQLPPPPSLGLRSVVLRVKWPGAELSSVAAAPGSS